jgi:molybdenum cofactor sulfurtransferase
MTEPTQATSQYSPENYRTVLAGFQKSYPDFDEQALDELRANEYGRLDEQGHVYLDYTGSGLYAASQLTDHMALLEEGVFGNPHSINPSSAAATELVESARDYVLRFFNASPDEYIVIFTPNASGALKLVAESYPFSPGGRYMPLFDNHNSVNGVREYARSRGAEVTYFPLMLPDLIVNADLLSQQLDQTQPGSHNLFAFPAQSNFSGVQHSLEWIDIAQKKGWDVMLDCAAFAPSNWLDLGRWKPDFVPLSFYKMFGYPTGAGCLIARKSALTKLQRPWFAGGTITITSVQGEGWHSLIDGSAGFEDGTVNFLTLPAVEIGLKHLENVGMDVIHERVSCLTGWLLKSMAALRHSTGEAMVEIYGPKSNTERGGTIAFNFIDPSGERFDYRLLEALAAEIKISLRTGCFCNPGTGETVHNLTQEDMAQAFSQPSLLSFEEFYTLARSEFNKNPSTVRVSVGIATTFADVYKFMAFAESFLDKSSADISALDLAGPAHGSPVDSA